MKTSALRDVLASSQSMRAQPLLICITTAQFDKTNFFYKQRSTDIEILKGLKDDDETFIAIYCLDQGDDYRDESVWCKAQPCLDVTVPRSFMRGQVVKAKNDIGAETGIKTKTFNIWCDTSETWIPSDYIRNCMTQDGKPFKFDWEKYRNTSYPVYAGVDLSAVDDTTALAICIFDEDLGKFVFKNYTFLPEDSLNKGANAEYYKLMQRAGYLITTPGNVIDYDAMTNILMKIQEEYGVALKIFYDPWASQQWAIKCTELGLNLEKCSQSMTNLSGPTKEFQRAILSNNCLIEANPIVEWMFSNVAIKSDWNDNVHIVKSACNNKVDNIVCMVECVCGFLLDYGTMPSIFSLTDEEK